MPRDHPRLSVTMAQAILEALGQTEERHEEKNTRELATSEIIGLGMDIWLRACQESRCDDHKAYDAPRPDCRMAYLGVAEKGLVRSLVSLRYPKHCGLGLVYRRSLNDRLCFLPRSNCGASRRIVDSMHVRAFALALLAQLPDQHLREKEIVCVASSIMCMCIVAC
jgi:hypothetical protein